MRRHRRATWRAFLQVGTSSVLCVGVMVLPVRADEISVAVAANFLNPLRALQTEFEHTSGHDILITAGSTGQLYAQITNGAPFAVLLAADREHPRLLAEEGWGDPSSVFTYAIGRLVLWSREAALVDESSLSKLGEARFRWLAIAEPRLAPYGAAAREVLEALGVWQTLQPRMVRGQNIAQTFAFVETQNAEIGLVALSQALAYEGSASYILVPQELYEPIRQDAIVLRGAARNSAALEFLAFLKGPVAAEIIERHGYAVPGQAGRD
jgi:molybdate transport system substrate-binding protein